MSGSPSPGTATAPHITRCAPPGYAIKALGFAVLGVITVLGHLIAWWHIPGTTRLEWQAAADGLLNDHLRLHRAGKETRRARGTILALCLAALAAAMVAMVRFAPPRPRAHRQGAVSGSARGRCTL